MASTTVDDYQILVRKLPGREGGGFFAEVVDLPGCGVDGATPHEALAECREALEMVLASYADRAKPAPTPGDYSSTAHSGRFIVRVPRSLHQRLILKARAEGVSLNHLCSSLLGEGLAARAERASADLTATMLRWLDVAREEREDETAWRPPSRYSLTASGSVRSASRSTQATSATKR